MDISEMRKFLDNPAELEDLYRKDRKAFENEFRLIYPEIKGQVLAEFWHERLKQGNSGISWGTKYELIFVLVTAIAAGLYAKLPGIFQWEPEFFYQRNAGFIVFGTLTAYAIWKNKSSVVRILLTAFLFLLALLFIHLLPVSGNSDTHVLSCIHLPLFLWFLFGVSHMGADCSNPSRRLEFLGFNGELIIMSGLLLIAGGLFTALTIGLFNMIGFDIEQFYIDYVVTIGLPAVPLLASYLTQSNPQLVNRISPVIARIFSPVVFIALATFLTAFFISDRDPYTNRAFLMGMNALLGAVMAIIFYSVAESGKHEAVFFNLIILFGLAFLTIIINCIALSAIIFRISEWGITPNRIVVLGWNILLLINLILIAIKLFRSVISKGERFDAAKTISDFLPVYILWAMIVIFILPIVFHFS